MNNATPTRITEPFTVTLPSGVIAITLVAEDDGVTFDFSFPSGEGAAKKVAYTGGKEMVREIVAAMKEPFAKAGFRKSDADRALQTLLFRFATSHKEVSGFISAAVSAAAAAKRAKKANLSQEGDSGEP